MNHPLDPQANKEMLFEQGQAMAQLANQAFYTLQAAEQAHASQEALQTHKAVFDAYVEATGVLIGRDSPFVENESELNPRIMPQHPLIGRTALSGNRRPKPPVSPELRDPELRPTRVPKPPAKKLPAPRAEGERKPRPPKKAAPRPQPAELRRPLPSPVRPPAPRPSVQPRAPRSPRI